MPRADFYLIDKPRFREQPLLLVCELAKRAYAAQQPTLILTRDFAQAEAIDELLWDFDADAYIPHQIAGDDDDQHTAVLVVPPGVDTPDRPLLINLRETCPNGRFERVLEVVAAEPSEREGSRTRWAEYKRLGMDVAKFDM
ncbi:DNA polymerase III subunit chi [Dyella sp. BiH032]|uniref:DNA polymerase III subunit chi n=1 Tax=Dyella sp. BiH032 TaxID=3075430 RepID=UPI00289382EE|nr:DNA polymerase III subunit chi [Dyella sp. BiH032]WNL45477.1 DNA polymerase III subunit chi [Dyella sp. BiH032]